MKRITLFALSLMVLGSLLWLSSCQSPDTPGIDDENLITREETLNLDDPYGGFNLGDEPPAFDDPVLLSEYSGTEDDEYDDPMQNNARIREMERKRINRFFVRITWGNLEHDTTIAFNTDWSGSLTVDNGAVLLKRIIRFEPDDAILPRTSYDLLEWESQTRCSYDGIIVKVIPVMKADAVTAAACNDSNTVVNFDFGPFTKSFTLAELRDMHEVFPVDEAGNAVSLDAIYFDPTSCPQGFLGGAWKRIQERPGGVFYGKWVTENGFHMGYLKGFYGTNSDGRQVFFGKYVDRDGRFRGLLKGRYWNTEEHRGEFAGVWMNRNMTIEGELKGVWKATEDGRGDGFFRARWRARCVNALQ